MRAALDTNILAYSEGIDDVEHRNAAKDLLGRTPAQSVVIPVQVLGELYAVLRRKGRRSPDAAARTVQEWRDLYTCVPTTVQAFDAARELASTHGLQIWDAIILAACSEAECDLLLTEDLQEGFAWRGVTVTNPFAAERHPLLVDLLGS